MKKQLRKLRLSRETVRDLDRESLVPVVGATAANCSMFGQGCAAYSPLLRTEQ